MNDLAIGIFDSGLGGLTAIKAANEIIPNENIIYFGDTMRNPYGNRDKSTLLHFTSQNINFLKSLGVKVILVACGTVSSYIREVESDIDVFGVIEPTCKAAIKTSKNGRIGILGTKTTINSNSYNKCINSFSKDIFCISQACPLFVPMIENGFISSDNSTLLTLIDLYVSPLVKQNIDTLILGCTHYPIIESSIRYIFGNSLNLINPGKELIKFLKERLISKDMTSKNKNIGDRQFYVSGDKEKFSKNAHLFLEEDISSRLEKIKIEDF